MSPVTLSNSVWLSQPLNLVSYPGVFLVDFGVFPENSALSSYCTTVVYNVFPSSFLNVTVYLFFSYFAVSVTSEEMLAVVVFSILFPFSSYHPTNVYPVFVGVGNSPYFWSYVTCFVDGVTFPPSASNC